MCKTGTDKPLHRHLLPVQGLFFFIAGAGETACFPRTGHGEMLPLL